MIAPKRQIVRLLTRQLDGFVAADAAVLHSGLVSSHYVTVNDTGARYSHNPHYPTKRSEKAPTLLGLIQYQWF
uniref:Uncharacterized protein n=1 Tax=Rhizobium rhizogenes TaxID=359 RepID=A0A7S5DRR7_RHIRH|nr:hypothetical protein pC5.7c_578 [Rhizobium rhizogenes]QCL09613.1 hypothetical protein pC5.8a_121 [Rhizobium rhizogenes]